MIKFIISDKNLNLWNDKFPHLSCDSQIDFLVSLTSHEDLVSLISLLFSKSIVSSFLCVYALKFSLFIVTSVCTRVINDLLRPILYPKKTRNTNKIFLSASITKNLGDHLLHAIYDEDTFSWPKNLGLLITRIITPYVLLF